MLNSSSTLQTMVLVLRLRIAIKTTRKAKDAVVKERESAHPRLGTECLFGVPGTSAQAVTSQVIRKRVHDDVCRKNANLPWRRSRVWLSARVALQIALMNAELKEEGFLHHKNFMLFLVSRLAANISPAKRVPDVLHSLRTKLAGRNAKLGSSTFAFVQNAVNEALKGIDENMQRLWIEVAQRDNKSVPPVSLDLLSTELLLKTSHSILRSVWDRSRNPFTCSFPSCTPASASRIVMPKESLPKPRMFDRAGYRLFCLVDFGLRKSWTAGWQYTVLILLHARTLL